jgi:hypothetical protein
MRFRPANIRRGNRRYDLPRLLLATPSKNGKNKINPIDVLALTGFFLLRIKTPWRGLCLATVF